MSWCCCFLILFAKWLLNLDFLCLKKPGSTWACFLALTSATHAASVSQPSLLHLKIKGTCLGFHGMIGVRHLRVSSSQQTEPFQPGHTPPLGRHPFPLSLLFMLSAAASHTHKTSWAQRRLPPTVPVFCCSGAMLPLLWSVVSHCSPSLARRATARSTRGLAPLAAAGPELSPPGPSGHWVNVSIFRGMGALKEQAPRPLG